MGIGIGFWFGLGIGLGLGIGFGLGLGFGSGLGFGFSEAALEHAAAQVVAALALHRARHDALRHPMGSLDARALIARVAPGFELGQHHDAAEFLHFLIGVNYEAEEEEDEEDGDSLDGAMTVLRSGKRTNNELRDVST